MKKYFLLFLFYNIAIAQVGINTTDPHAQLDIKSSDQVNPANNDGILIPKIDAFPAINPTIDQDGMMVYLTTDVGANLKGFYYWDNTYSIWKSISGNKGWSLTGNAGTNVATNFIGTTDNVGLKFIVNNISAGFLYSDVSSNTNFGYETLTNNGFNYSDAFGFQTLKMNSTGLANAAFGRTSLTNNTTGSLNCAFGSSSLYNNTSGNRNIAFGVGSLAQNNADDNVAIGYYASGTNTSGFNNVAIGTYSSFFNTTGSNNTAIGYQTLYYNTTGNYNGASGYQALFNNTTGFGNNAYGNRSLYSNVSGDKNTAFGNATLYNNIASGNTAFGNESMYSSVSGIDNSAFGNQSLYKNTTGTQNAAFGSKSLFTNTNGNYNSAFGFASLYSNTIGNYNSAFGWNSLTMNTTGNYNTAVGNESLSYNTSGSYNVALGYKTINTSGGSSYNTAVGYNALYAASGAFDNAAFGANSLVNNTSGDYNVAVGSRSLKQNTTGQYNVTIGVDSVLNNTTGDANNALGAGALKNCISGTGNIAVGQESNPTTTTGWNNIGIGFHSLGNIDGVGNRILGNQIGFDNIAFGLVAGDRIGNNCNQSAFIGPFSNVITNDTNVSNSTAIGNGALVFQNNMMRLGNSAITRIETQVGLTVVSDGRYKFNVKEEVKGLDFIKKLRPVVYQYDTEKMDREWMNVEFDTMAKHNPQILKDYKKASQIRYSGFIAQEVENAAQSINYEFSGLSKPENSDGHYGLDYASFVVPLVKSIQEQQEEIEDLKKQLASEKNKNNQIENRLKVIEEKLSK